MVSTYSVLAIILLRVTPSAKRNSYRVARGAHHPRCATYIIDIGKARHRRTSYIHALEHHTHHDETHTSSGNSYIHAHKHYTHHDEHHVSSSNSYIHAHEHHTHHDETHVSSGNSYIHAHEYHTHNDETHVSSGNSYIHAHEHHIPHDEHHVSSGNSVGVAIPQPRVAGEARYPGYAPPLIWLLCKSCD